MAYLTAEELKQTLSLEQESYANDDIAVALSAAETAVNSETGRRFDLDGSDVERLYQPTRRSLVEIDDCSHLTSASLASNGGSYGALDVSNFRLFPLNAAADGQPYEELRLISGEFCRGDTLKIVGRFGWPSVPDSVKQATTMIASRFLKRSREAPFGVAGFGADGLAVRIASTDPDVQMLLGPLARKHRLS